MSEINPIPFDIFPSINRDAAGDRRPIHDMLNFQPLQRQSGVSPIRGTSATHEINGNKVGVHIYIIDATEFDLTDGYIIAAVDHDDVDPTTGNPAILSMKYRKDPLDRARNLFTGDWFNDMNVFIVPYLSAATYDAYTDRYYLTHKLAKVDLDDMSVTNDYGSLALSWNFDAQYDVTWSTGAGIVSSRGVPLKSCNIFWGVNKEMILTTYSDILVMDASDGSTTKTMSIASEAFGPVYGNLCVTRSGQYAYFVAPQGNLYRFRVAGSGTTISAVAGITEFTAGAGAPHGPVEWLVHSSRNEIFSLGVRDNYVHLLKLSLDKNDDPTYEWEIDFFTDHSYKPMFDSLCNIAELQNGNLFVHWVGNDASSTAHFIEIDPDDGSIVNSQTITNVISDVYGKSSLSPDRNYLYKTPAYSPSLFMKYDISDLSSTPTLEWSTSPTLPSPYDDVSYAIVTARNGQVYAITSGGGSGELNIGIVEIDDDDGTLVSGRNAQISDIDSLHTRFDQEHFDQRDDLDMAKALVQFGYN